MRSDQSHTDLSGALASDPVARFGAGHGEVAMPRLALPRARLRAWRAPLALRRPDLGVAALAVLFAGCLAVVVFATAQPTILVARSRFAFPDWMSGPLHGLFGPLIKDPQTLGLGFTAVLLAMMVAYGVVLLSVRMLSMRTIVVAVVALHAVMLLSPPLELTDLFNYLGYARLGALHHLNPYQYVIGLERHDPIFHLASWDNLRSPYGPAFTLLTYPLGLLPLSVAYWALKTATILASLGVLALVWRCARQLGRDPRFAVLLVAANPIVLIYGLGGFHNDVFMLVPAIGAISLLLDRRDGLAGATLMLAVAIKFTAVLLLPFLLVAAGPWVWRRLRLLAGIAIAATALAAASIAAFGFATPNLSDQSSILTPYSVPNLVGMVLGLGGGTPTLLHLATLVVLIVVAALVVVLVWRGGDWLSAAGWATFALICSLAWLVPWYIVWVLPLAGLGTSVRLRRAALAFSLFLLLSFAPATHLITQQMKWSTMRGAASRASLARQAWLER
jgi:hypothetical protein